MVRSEKIACLSTKIHFPSLVKSIIEIESSELERETEAEMKNNKKGKNEL